MQNMQSTWELVAERIASNLREMGCEAATKDKVIRAMGLESGRPCAIPSGAKPPTCTHRYSRDSKNDGKAKGELCGAPCGESGVCSRHARKAAGAPQATPTTVAATTAAPTTVAVTTAVPTTVAATTTTAAPASPAAKAPTAAKKPRAPAKAKPKEIKNLAADKFVPVPARGPEPVDGVDTPWKGVRRSRDGFLYREDGSDVVVFCVEADGVRRDLEEADLACATKRGWHVAPPAARTDAVASAVFEVGVIETPASDGKKPEAAAPAAAPEASKAPPSTEAAAPAPATKRPILGKSVVPLDLKTLAP